MGVIRLRSGRCESSSLVAEDVNLPVRILYAKRPRSCITRYCTSRFTGTFTSSATIFNRVVSKRIEPVAIRYSIKVIDPVDADRYDGQTRLPRVVCSFRILICFARSLHACF